MKGKQDPIPGWGTRGPARDSPASDRRPIWALPALILGLLIAGWILVLLVDFVVRTLADPGGSVVRTMVLGYVLPFIVPLSAILLVAGGLGVMRPWTAIRPRLRLVWIGGVLTLAVSAFTIPWLISGPTKGSGTVDGLPGQREPWSGTVECAGAPDTGLDLAAKVPASASDRGKEFEVHAIISGDGSEIYVWYDRSSRRYSSDTFEGEHGGARGVIVAEPDSLLPFLDDPPSQITLTWDCSGAP